MNNNCQDVVHTEPYAGRARGRHTNNLQNERRPGHPIGFNNEVCTNKITFMYDSSWHHWTPEVSPDGTVP